jgi:hypothetical protein
MRMKATTLPPTDIAWWAQNYDDFSKPMPAPPTSIPTYKDPLAYAGKVSHPSGLPGGNLLLTWGVGACSEVADGTLVGNVPGTSGSGGWTSMYSLTLLGRDNPGCDAGIYMTTKVPSAHPSDLRAAVNTREWHEIMARPVIPYADVHGIAEPAVIPRAEVAAAGDPDVPAGTPFGVLGASSILFRETHALNGDPFSAPPNPYVHWGLQGTDVLDYTDDELCGVRILVTQPAETNNDYMSLSSQMTSRILVLGEFPVRKADAHGQPILDPTGAPDTSFKVSFPADTPYLMQGIDCQGRTLNSDQTWQSLRPGEVKTCGGCHVHSKPGIEFNTVAASAPGFKLNATLGSGNVPLLAGGSGSSVTIKTQPGYGLAYQYERDVWPILANRCASCHSGTSPAGGLALDQAGTGQASTYERLVLDRSQAYVPAAQQFPASLWPPQATKYIRSLQSRGSLLYWKAANQRTDGRTDGQYTTASPAGWNDVDFGAEHPTSITPDELGVLSRWIDTGCAAGSALLQDTTPPVLHVAGRVSKSSIASLYVGTADAGEGVDVHSLTVCLVAHDGSCGPNLAPAANPSGVVSIPLSPPLSDPNQEVRAQIADLAGNTTTQKWTVGWLLDQQAPSQPDAGPGTSSGTDGGDGPPAGGPPPSSGASPSDSREGCGCSLLGTPATTPAAALFIFIGLTLRRRQRSASGTRRQANEVAVRGEAALAIPGPGRT